MNIPLFTTPNTKGQIVIPKTIRKALSIDETVMLSIKVTGNSIHITPVKHFISPEETESSYVELLKKTQGAWGEKVENEKQKSQIELHASSKRKHPW